MAIDCGKSGAIWIDHPFEKFSPLALLDNNDIDIQAFTNLVKQCKVTKIIIEEPFITPGNKNKGLTTQLIDYGILYGLSAFLVGSGNVIVIRPRVWKSKLQLASNKQSSINKAKQINNSLELRFTKRCRVDNHNMAEAYLMAYYARTFL
jgi:hypothetical protein